MLNSSNDNNNDTENDAVNENVNVNEIKNPLSSLKTSPKNIVISYLNVNSIRNKLNAVRNLILENVDILCIAESKLDSSFPAGQFSVPGFKQPIRLDISDKSGGLLLYARDKLPLRQLRCPVQSDDIQCIVADLNLRKQKWLILSIYRNPKQDIRYFLDEIIKILDYYSSDYENLIIMGDFNEESNQSYMINFMSNFNLYNLIKRPTCYKSTEGRCIDLILTNKNRSFQKSNSYETGISDHHHLIYTMFKTTHERSPPHIVHYRCFRTFSPENFRRDLSESLIKCTSGDFTLFNLSLEKVLDAHAPKKKRSVRGNQKHHMTKTLRKAIMRRSFLKNKANKTGDPYFDNLYKKQRNYVVNLNKKAKETHFRALGTSPDFWKSTKSLFSKNSQMRESVLLRDDQGNVIRNEKDISQIFNSFFVNITNNLNISPWENCHPEEGHVGNEIESILRKYQSHPSILSITQSNTVDSFSFANVTSDQVLRIILKLDPKKSVSGPISSKIVRMVADIISQPIARCINVAIESSNFPNSLKLAVISPIFKKGDKFLKENYRPISILPCLSKIFERAVFDQLSGYFDGILHSQLCGYRSKHNTQHALLRMIGRWGQCLDRSGKVGAILMDLSKAFDCIDHGLLLAKLSAYGLDRKSLCLVRCYLSDRFQKTKVGSYFSTWLKIIKGVPQGSILGPLLFNIFINDLLSIIKKTDICNFADDNSLYSCEGTLLEVVSNLKHDLSKVLNWLAENQLVANPLKFQMLVLGESDLPITINVGNFSITSSDTVELLGILIDSKLTFSDHINSLCHRARNRVRNLIRIRKCLSQNQLLLLFNSYILSIFTYAPVVWMFCSKKLCGEIDRIHKRALRAVFCDFLCSYEVLLQNSGCKRIHEIHIFHLLSEVYKTLHNLNPSFMQTLFKVKSISYSLRNQNLLVIPAAKSQRFGTQSFLFRGSLLWNNLPDSVKMQNSLATFKHLLKASNLLNLCTCRICKI